MKSINPLGQLDARRRPGRDKKVGRTKQIQSAMQALSLAVITGSADANISTMKPEETETHILEKIRDVQRIYGLPLCLEVAPFIIQRMKKDKKCTIMMGDDKKTKREIYLIYKPLERYYNKFCLTKEKKEVKKDIEKIVEEGNERSNI